MEKCTNGPEIPLGLGIALEQYNSMDSFLSLSQEAQQQIINNAHRAQSKNEMLEYVQSLITLK